MTESATVNASSVHSIASRAEGIPELDMGLTWMLRGVFIRLPRFLPQGDWTAHHWIAIPLLLAGSGFERQSVIWRLALLGSGVRLAVTLGGAWRLIRRLRNRA